MGDRPELIRMDSCSIYLGPLGNIPVVGVLMSTYKGEKYLPEQVESVAMQKNVNVHMFVRDDGSTDSTPSVLRKMSRAPRGRISTWSVENGGNLGFLKSFEGLLMNADGCDYYAFCDQDDVWLQGKLDAAVHVLNETDGPALYASGVHIVDENLAHVGENSFPGFVYSIPSELIRHRLAGHTMVWNAALQQELVRFGSLTCWSHDQHVALAALMAGAPLYLDESSYVLHRRLASSATPGGNGVLKRVRHEARMLWNPGREWDRAALAQAILDAPGAHLNASDRRFLQECATRRRLALACDPAFDCGLTVGNLEARATVLLGRF